MLETSERKKYPITARLTAMKIRATALLIAGSKEKKQRPPPISTQRMENRIRDSEVFPGAFRS
jgi:hypothetical protein